MTPAARIAAAIEVLDEYLTGAWAEKALQRWSRRSRFAGSKDRAAIRDLVFDAVRARSSFAALGGSETGRGLMIGRILDRDENPAEVFTGQAYAPEALTDTEHEQLKRTPEMPEYISHDVPDWLWQTWQTDVENAEEAAMLSRRRAQVFIRRSLRHAAAKTLKADLQQQDILTKPHPISDTALCVISNERRLHMSDLYKDGAFDLQDAASQMAVSRLPIQNGDRVLDYCAGAGGKSLAIADRWDVSPVAHDIDTFRMADIPDRAARLGVSIAVQSTDELSDASFDLVLVDAPCSGSGTWRRSPEAKWRLTPNDLDRYEELQRSVLTSAARYVAPGGCLAYATCSVLKRENTGVITWFQNENKYWRVEQEMSLNISEDHDGFFLCVLRKV